MTFLKEFSTWKSQTPCNCHLKDWLIGTINGAIVRMSKHLLNQSIHFSRRNDGYPNVIRSVCSLCLRQHTYIHSCSIWCAVKAVGQINQPTYFDCIMLWAVTCRHQQRSEMRTSFSTARRCDRTTVFMCSCVVLQYACCCTLFHFSVNCFRFTFLASFSFQSVQATHTHITIWSSNNLDNGYIAECHVFLSYVQRFQYVRKPFPSEAIYSGRIEDSAHQFFKRQHWTKMEQFPQI